MCNDLSSLEIILNIAFIESLSTLRTVVGYLGEREHFNWWPSAFLSAGSHAFLAPVFGKTQLLAQVSGVTQAAALHHDERIGVGHVYHLFRLPEDMEQKIHRVLHDRTVEAQIEKVIASEESAFSVVGCAGWEYL